MIFASFICLLSLPQIVESMRTQNKNHVDSKTTSCNINHYYGLHSRIKKFENIIMDMKRKLDAIELKLRNLSKNKGPNSKGCFADKVLMENISI